MSTIYESVIKEYYGERKAERTQIPYINHIYEGLIILDAINASDSAKYAYMLHPIYQVKKTDLEREFIAKYQDKFDEHVVLLAKEYAKTANSYLCKRHYQSKDDVINLSQYKEVNDMLIADKIQNRKDFEESYENQSDKEKFDRSDRLSQYFKNWIKVLGLSEEQYEVYKKLIV